MRRSSKLNPLQDLGFGIWDCGLRNRSDAGAAMVAILCFVQRGQLINRRLAIRSPFPAFMNPEPMVGVLLDHLLKNLTKLGGGSTKIGLLVSSTYWCNWR